jgi:hypothetical protein
MPDPPFHTRSGQTLPHGSVFTGLRSNTIIKPSEKSQDPNLGLTVRLSASLPISLDIYAKCNFQKVTSTLSNRSYCCKRDITVTHGSEEQK